MDTESIQSKILEIFKRCKIKQFPINCFSVLKTLEIVTTPYSDLSEKKQKSCHLISDDAFTLTNAIYYNDHVHLDGRLRFSLMHELGHITLKHLDFHEKEQEQEANFFASHFLAPRMIIHYTGCKNANDVAKRFHLSTEAADYAFQDYRRWHRLAIYRMSVIDQKIYDYFYEPTIHKFAYDTHPCIFCQNMIYNQPDEPYCPSCRRQSIHLSDLHHLSPESRIQAYIQNRYEDS